MATHTFSRPRVDSSHASVHFSEACSVLLDAGGHSAASPVRDQAFDSRVPQDALKGAKGAVAALGLEVGAGILLCGFWLVWHLIR